MEHLEKGASFSFPMGPEMDAYSTRAEAEWVGEGATVVIVVCELEGPRRGRLSLHTFASTFSIDDVLERLDQNVSGALA